MYNLIIIRIIIFRLFETKHQSYYFCIQVTHTVCRPWVIFFLFYYSLFFWNSLLCKIILLWKVKDVMQREIKSIHLQLIFGVPEVSESSSSLVSSTLGLCNSCVPRSEVGPSFSLSLLPCAFQWCQRASILTKDTMIEPIVNAKFYWFVQYTT